jgi:hypothetical protein
MVSIRPFLLSLAVPASLAACGGGDDGPIVPEGPHHTYVASEAHVPVNATQSRDFGLDLGSSTDNKPDGVIDNQLGMVLATLSGQAMFDVQGTINDSVATGSIILLLDLQTADYQASGAVGLAVKLGDNPQPAACTNPDDITTCGQHLKGGATFQIAAGSPNDAAVTGKIVGGTFNGGPGDITLQIALGAAPVTLNLKSARVKASGMSDAGITTATLAGALLKTDLDQTVIPAIQTQLVPIIERDCTDPTNPPDCGCVASSTGKTILGLFDADPKDCAVSVAEIQNNALIKSLLAPDVCTQATCAMPDALSLGIQVKAVSAVFPTE